MKTLLKIISLATAFGAGVASAATHVVFDLNAPHFNAYPSSNRWVTLQPLTPFPGNLVNYTSGPAGTFVVSNMYRGDYAGVVKPKGTAGQILFQITVTAEDLGVIGATNITSVPGVQTYPTSGRAAWTIQASDLRYLVNATGAVGVVSATNIAAYQAFLATNNYAVTVTNIIDGYPGSNINATTATNIAAYQALLATNNYAPAATNIAAYQAKIATNGYDLRATNIAAYQTKIATNGLAPFTADESQFDFYPLRLISGATLTNITIHVSNLVPVLTNNDFNIGLHYSDPDGWVFSGAPTLTAGQFQGDGHLLTNLPIASITNIGTLGYSNTAAFLPLVTNIAKGEAATATNALSGVLVTRTTAATNDLNTVLVNRLIATNTALEAKLQRGSAILTNIAATGALTNAAAGSNTTVSVANGTLTVNAHFVTNSFTTNTEANARLVVTNIFNALNTASGGSATNAWGFNGNAGLDATNFIGTTDNVDLVLKVNGKEMGRFHDTGGPSPSITLGSSNAIGGSAPYSVIGGGIYNTNANFGGDYGVIAGGFSNRIGTAAYAAKIGTISGGERNYLTGVVAYATIPGGLLNTVGGSYGFAAGRRAKAMQNGTFVWADSTDADFASTGLNQFLIRSAGGVGVNTNNPGSAALRVAGAGEFTGDLEAGTTFTMGSNTVFTVTTNNIVIAGAGSDYANGTYQNVSTVKWTNNLGAVLTNISGNYAILSNTVTLYTSAGTPYGAGWVLGSGGANPTPTGAAGSYLNLAGNTFLGWLNSSNLEARLTAATNWLVANSFTTNTDAAAKLVTTNIANAAAGTRVLTNTGTSYNQTLRNATNIGRVTVDLIVATNFTGNGAGLTNLDIHVTQPTWPQAVFVATDENGYLTEVGAGGSLIDAGEEYSGLRRNSTHDGWEVYDTRDGSLLTGVPVAGIDASGTPSSANFLRGDATWTTTPLPTFNNNQFGSASGTTNIKSGATATNLNLWGTTTVKNIAQGQQNLVISTDTPGDDPVFYFTQVRQATTDASPQTATLVTAATNNTYLVEARVTARRTGGAAGSAGDSAGYVVRGLYKDIAGTVTLVGSLNADFTAESQAGWDATLVISGSNIQIQFTGAADNNVTWSITATITYLNQ